MLNNDDVLHIAKLARLDLSGDEVEKFKTQLSDVLDLFKSVDDVDLKDVEETSQVSGLSNVFTADEVVCAEGLTCCTTDELISNVPLRDGSSIKVPKVIGGTDNA